MDRKGNGEKAFRRVFPTKITLCPGDIICPKCKGKKWISHGNTDFEYTCTKCWGAGKLDWIEVIMGKQSPMRRLDANWTFEMHAEMKQLYETDEGKEIIDYLSKDLADKIDEEIIGKIVDLSVTKK